MINWKTTAAGLATILSIVAKMLAAGHIDWAIDGPAIMGGIGLLAARDHNNSATAPK